MTSAMSGDVKGDIGEFVVNRDGTKSNVWAHREPTPEEESTRRLLAPWLAGARGSDGKRITLRSRLELLENSK